jgi:hypothetical protein
VGFTAQNTLAGALCPAPSTAPFQQATMANCVLRGPVLMKQGISYKIKLIYDEDMVKLPLASVYHMENTSYTWNEADPKEKVTAFFTLAKPVKPIIDICGLILAKKIV